MEDHPQTPQGFNFKDNYKLSFRINGQFYQAFLQLTSPQENNSELLIFKSLLEDLKIRTIPEKRLAFDLVAKSFIRCCRSIWLELENKLDSQPVMPLPIQENLDIHIEEYDFLLNEQLFENPRTSKLIVQFKTYLYYWVQKCWGVNSKDAGDICFKVTDIFWNSLINEWDEKQDVYRPIFTKFTDNPFREEWSQNLKIQKYYNELKKHYGEFLMGDKSLKIRTSDIYIDPGFKISKRSVQNDVKRTINYDRNDFARLNDQCDSIHNYLNKYFLSKKGKIFGLTAEKSRLMLVLGQPGQGKTSFCYRLVSDLLTDITLTQEVVFLRLRRLGGYRDFVDRPLEVLEGFFERYYHFKPNLNDCILILDGLDELYMNHGLTETALNAFFEELTNHIKNAPKLKVIITSRYHYINLKKISPKKALITCLSPLTLNQQKNWLTRYRVKNPQTTLDFEILEEINSTGPDDDMNTFKDFINQPVLLTLIAKSNIQLHNYSAKNRSKIYETLFDQFFHSWQNEELEDRLPISLDQFREYLGAIALKIYQSENPYMLISELNEMTETEQIKDSVENIDNQSLQKSIEESLKKILINFYFEEVSEDFIDQNQNKNREYAFEFLHKSLREYLAAEHIYRLIKEEFLAKKNKTRFHINHWEVALSMIWNIFSRKPLSLEVMEYLEEIIENDSDKKGKKLLGERLARFFPNLLSRQFIHEIRFNPKSNNPLLTFTSCFHAYCNILSLLRGKNLFFTNGRENFIKLFKVTQTLHPSRFNLIGVNLNKLDLSHFNFRYCNLKRINFSHSNLSHSNFYNADLRRANFLKSDLRYSDLYHADLRGAKLSRSKLSWANLENAYVDSPDWFDQLEKAKVIGVKSLRRRFKINQREYKDDENIGFYLVLKNK